VNDAERRQVMYRYFFVFIAGMAAGAALLALYEHGPVFVVGTAEVVDGDNIRIAGWNVRLIGINAPELPVADGKDCRRFLSRPECVEPSAAALHERVGGRRVSCWILDHDRFGRPLGVCYWGREELNVWLIENCHAGSPPNPAHRLERYEEIIASRVC
jgi:endonuclease YncB( thermonuclease family)